MNKLGQYSISQLGDPLGEEETIPCQKRGYLHLVVEGLEPVPIQCWVKERSFEVATSGYLSVDGFKNEIKKVHLWNVDAYALDLYKVTESGSKLLLDGRRWMQEVIKDVPFGSSPQIIVEQVAEHQTLQLPHDPQHHIRAQYFQELASTPLRAPSDQAMPTEFNSLQATARRIDWSRPDPTCAGIPVTLLDPIFGRLVDECHDFEDKQRNYDAESDINALVAQLFSKMAVFHPKEKERQETFIDIFRQVGVGIVPSSSGGCVTDGDLHVNSRRYMILEVKGEVGSKAAEPYCQAVLYYIKTNEQAASKAHNDGTPFNFPCLILTLFGPHLCLSGAVWGARPTYQVLSTVLPLFWHPSDTTLRRIAARHVSALMNALNALETRYQEFIAKPANFRSFQPAFPHPRSYRNSDGEKGFKYVCSLQAGKLLFVARTDDDELLCIKFVRGYNREAHALCASWGIAPSLRAFEDKVAGGWKMVVMDLLEDYQCLFQCKSLSFHQKEGVKDELKTKLMALHQAGFVHGDIRDTNVMLHKDRLQWRLVDFDWSGKIGEVRYPMNVKRGVDLRRPPGAQDGQLILAQHDIDMVQYLFS